MKLWRVKGSTRSCYVVATNEEHARDVFQSLFPQCRVRSRIAVKEVKGETSKSALDLLAAGMAGLAELHDLPKGHAWWSLRKVGPA